MSAPMLLLDAGNTRLKWRRVDGARRDSGAADYTDLNALRALLSDGLACFVASVARNRHAALLEPVFAPFSIRPVWLGAQAVCCGVTNGYADPSQLGVDRWMALVGARARTHSATLVVSAGTALTIDALTADGRFIGGVIVPGLRLMREALGAGTAEVSTLEGIWQAFPRTTGDAVESGLLDALSGAVSQQFARLADASDGVPQCLVTGGDAERLLARLALAAEHVPHLILEGIERVAKEGAGW